MARLNAANNARTTLSADITASQTSFTVAGGAIFPAPPFKITVDNEIMEVGAKSTNTLSEVLRGREGTTAASHTSGSIVENKLTADAYNELATEAQVTDLAGEGHTTETVKGVADEVIAHKAETVTDDVHGLSRQIVEETGTNTNGQYVKFSNGFGIASGYINLEGKTTSADINGSFAITLPMTFAYSGVEGVICQYAVNTYAKNSAPVITNVQRISGGSTINVFTGGNAYTFLANCYLSFIVCGRWK